MVGLDRHLNYFKLQYGLTCLLQNRDCLFLATNTDVGGADLGPGACGEYTQFASALNPALLHPRSREGTLAARSGLAQAPWLAR